MKVLQVPKFYPPDLGGIEAVARDLSAGLVAGGIEVAVLCANKHPSRSEEVDALGVRITRAASMGMLQSTSIAPSMLSILRRCRLDFDIVHVHMPDPMAALAVWFARPSGKVVVHWHSDVVRQRVAKHLYRPLERWLLRRADAVIATSQPYADSSPALQAFRDKVEVIPIGAHAPEPADPQQVERLRQRYEGRRIVFSLGRMTYYKGWDVLARASRELPDDVLVVVGGGGPELPRYREMAERIAGPGRIRFVGPLTAASVEAHFELAQVFCLASTLRAEAYGVAALEAMARGRPVVATRIPGSGLSWLNEDGVTGLQVPPGDAAALARALRTLLGDTELRERCAEAARRRWATLFTAETMTGKTMALYQRLMNARTTT